LVWARHDKNLKHGTRPPPPPIVIYEMEKSGFFKTNFAFFIHEGNRPVLTRKFQIRTRQQSRIVSTTVPPSPHHIFLRLLLLCVALCL
jgi:hypothetical protein